jgi:Transposase zinc-binding domain
MTLPVRTHEITGMKVFNTRAAKATEKITGKGYSAIDNEALKSLPPPPPGAVFNAEEQAKYRAFKEARRGYAAFLARLTAEGRTLPRYVQHEFEAYLKYGLLEHGFMRVRCKECHREKFVAFSCKRRGFCPSRGARRMVESAALRIGWSIRNRTSFHAVACPFQ